MKLKIRKYNVEPSRIPCGTEGSFGIETMEFEFDPTWDGLDKAITFYPPRREPISVEIADEPISVPWEVTDRTGSVPFVITGLSESRSIKTRTAFLNVSPSKKGDGADPTDPWEYTAGANIQISPDRVISATDTKYTAGDNIAIEGNEISATYEPGNGIDITGGVISATGGGTPGVFYVTYNSTTFAQITAALDGGQYPVVRYTGDIFLPLYEKDYKNGHYVYVFTSSYKGNNYFMSVDDTDAWEDLDFSISQPMSQRVYTISSSSDDNSYPTAKAVYTAIQGAVPSSSVMTFPGTLSDNTFTLSSHNYKDISDYYDAGYLCVIKGGGMSYIVTSIIVSTAGGQNLYTIYALALGSALYRLTSQMGLGTGTTFTRTSATLAFS